MNNYTTNQIFAISAVSSFSILVISLLIEHYFKISPCRLCLIQRWIIFSVSGCSAIGFLFENKSTILRVQMLLVSALFCVSIFHALIQFGYVKDFCIVPKIANASDFWNTLNKQSGYSAIPLSMFGIPLSVFNALYSSSLIAFIIMTNENLVL